MDWIPLTHYMKKKKKIIISAIAWAEHSMQYIFKSQLNQHINFNYLYFSILFNLTGLVHLSRVH